MTVYVQVVNTAIGLLFQQECIKVGDFLIVKKMPIIAICFGLMTKTQKSANIKELKEKEKFVI
jgi:hypothetical protein